MSKVLVVGGGAAGMFAAIFAAYNGNEVHLFEKNEKLGKKIFITGKGRCNITNASDMETLFASVVTNSKFLYSSFYGYTNQDVIDFFENIGVHTKIERGNRVFPVSDHSSDVIVGLTKELHKLGVEIHLRAEVEKVVGTERFEYIWVCYPCAVLFYEEASRQIIIHKVEPQAYDEIALLARLEVESKYEK